MASALFVSREDEVKVFGVVDGIEYGKNCATRVANYKSLVAITTTLKTEKKRSDVQMCLTSCLSIISWKISPPVLPMNLFNS